MLASRLTLIAALSFFAVSAIMAQDRPPEGSPPQGAPPEDKGGPKFGEGPGGGPRGGLNVFFSPAGEPFHGGPGPDAPYALKAWFDAADANHDGKLDRVEFLSDAERFFRIVDQDKNEIISSPENTRYEQVLAPEILRFDQRLSGGQGRPRRPAGGGGEDGSTGPQTYVKTTQGAAQYSLIGEPQPIRACDDNLDYKVTLKEWTMANTQRFALLDRNHDGVLEMSELPQTPAAVAIERLKKEAEKGGAKGKGERKKSGLW
jgi:hypothetical protein